MFAGIDVGCTLTKIAYLDESGDYGLLTMSSGDWRAEPSGLDPVSAALEERGVKLICATGAGAEAFRQAAADLFTVIVPEGDAVSGEILMQAEGAKELLAHQGFDAREFLLVSVGSGVSFTRVSGDIIALYEPGLSIGGRFITALASLVEVGPEDIDELSVFGDDSDLLMKHVFPRIGYPKGEFVIASLGRLEDMAGSEEDICYGALKTVATCVAGKVMDIGNNPDWKWRGPVVYIGTPVNAYGKLRDLLSVFTLGLGLTGIFPTDGQYACALGALKLAQIPGGEIRLLEPAGPLKRFGAAISRKAQLLGSLLRRK